MVSKIISQFDTTISRYDSQVRRPLFLEPDVAVSTEEPTTSSLASDVFFGEKSKHG